MKLTKTAAFGAAIGVILAGAAIAAPANADPVSDGFSIVGSDTLQDAVGALANGTTVTGTSVRTSGLGKYLASWDAFTPGITGGIGLVQTKAYGSTFPRPSGSGNGKNALLASISESGTWNVSSVSLYTNAGLGGSYNIKGQVDLSRSSSAPTANSSGSLYYIPFGQDAVSYAYVAGADVDAASLSYVASLSTAQLKAIYESASNTAIPSTDDVIVPRLPQSGSGTRSFWLTVLNGGSGSITPGAASNASATTLAENDGTVLTPSTSEIWVIPFSAASYIAQANGAATSRLGSALLGSPNGVAASTGTAPNLAGNSALYTSSYGRTVYIVVPWAKIDSSAATFDAALWPLVDADNPTSLTYWNAANSLKSTSMAVKIKFGFQAPTGTATRAS